MTRLRFDDSRATALAGGWVSRAVKFVLGYAPTPA